MIQILVRSKDDPKTIYAEDLIDGLTLVVIEAATKGGQLGIEFIIKSLDNNGNIGITRYAITENEMEALAGALIGTRMRFGRMPGDEYEIVRYYVRDQAKRFLGTLDESKRLLVEDAVKKFFGVS